LVSQDSVIAIAEAQAVEVQHERRQKAEQRAQDSRRRAAQEGGEGARLAAARGAAVDNQQRLAAGVGNQKAGGACARGRRGERGSEPRMLSAVERSSRVAAADEDREKGICKYFLIAAHRAA
jgi:hypothetical protein